MFILKFKKHKSDKFKEIFVGRKTFFTLIGFSIGSILVARSLWEYGRIYIGIPATILFGIAIFIGSGIILKKFDK